MQDYKYAEVMDVRVEKDVLAESFDFGEKMLGKYAGFDALMDLKDDEYADMKQMYKLVMKFKDEAVKSIKQQNLQTDMIYDLTVVIRELRNEIAFLREDIDSLRSSKTKKKLDDFKKGLSDLGVEEVEED